MKSTYSISFYCRSSKVSKKTGLAPIEMSISVNTKRTFINLPQKVLPSTFEKAMNSKRGNEIKTFCNAYYAKANEAVRVIVANNDNLTVDAIKCYVLGINKNSTTLSMLAKDYLKYSRLRVAANEIELTTYCKYSVAIQYLLKALGDIEINNISASVVDELRLRLLKEYEESTANRYLRRFKTIFSWGEERGLIDKSPFALVKVKNVVKEVEYLTPEEISRIEEKHFDIDRLDKVKDLFLFQCYTSLSFSDMQQLTEDDIKECEQGMYIKKERQKTKIEFTILLLPKAVGILKKYNFQLPKVSNQRMNSYLKEIGDCCQITKPLHTHIGRHTAATMFLNAGLSLDEVAKILGHRCATTITAHYAKLMDKTIFNAMAKLK